MKMNIKGLVFVGFAAAVFAGAAQADPTDLERKTVTSKPYVDSKIVQTVGESDETHAPSGAAVHAYVKNTTLTIAQGDENSNTVLGTFTANSANDQTIYIPTPAEQAQSDWDVTNTELTSYIAHKPTITNDSADITGAAQTDTKELPTTYAVQQYVANNNANWDETTTTSPAYIDNKPTITNDSADITGAAQTDTKELPTTYAVQQYMATNQANWTETTTTSPSYIQNKPGNFGGTDGTSAGTAGFVPAPAATDSGKVLGAGGTWVDMWTTPNGVNCSPTSPCALVNAGSGPEWQYIQQ